MSDHAVVIGGTRGLGRVVVERFRARGCAVSVVSRNRPDDFETHPGLRHFSADLERCDGYAGLCQRIAEDGGPIRYLILAQRFRGESDPWVGEIQVSLTASRDLIEGFADRFVDAGDRAIAAVSSVYAEFTGSSQPVGYHAVKAGLTAMVRNYAVTLGRRGIRVNAMLPMTFSKPESRGYYEKNDRLMEIYRRLVPLGRLGTAEECADVLDFLCSDRASFINGQSLFVDGGVSAVWQEEVAKSFAGS